MKFSEHVLGSWGNLPREGVPSLNIDDFPGMLYASPDFLSSLNIAEGPFPERSFLHFRKDLQ